MLDAVINMINLTADTKEKLESVMSMGGMFVKILMASFPMMFVPQMCEDGPCSMSDKMSAWSWLSFVNVMTFTSFMRLYYVQGHREHFMIEYLDEDDEVSENSLTEQIVKYPKIHSRLVTLNSHIKTANNVSAAMFLLNTIYSSFFILYLRYLDTTTATVLLTNSLLVQGKLMQIRQSYTSDDLAMSTVATVPKVFNVIDTDHVVKEPIDLDEVELNVSTTP